MSGFLVIAIMMTVIAVVVVLLPLKKWREQSSQQRSRANLAVLRDQMKELEVDYAAGEIGKKELEEARAELNRRTLEESEGHDEPEAVSEAAQTSNYGKRAALGVAAFCAILVVGGLFYWRIGTPTAFLDKTLSQVQSQENAHSLTPDQMEKMLATFAERMKNEPDNVEGWMMLARSYAQTDKYQEAINAYEHLLQRVPDNADVLADYADLLGVVQNGDLSGRPTELIQRALKVEPNHWKALWLAGTFSFNKGDYAHAVDYWTRLKKILPPDAEMTQAIAGNINEAQKRQKIKLPK